MRKSYQSRIVGGHTLPLDPLIYTESYFRDEASAHFETFLKVLRRKWPKIRWAPDKMWPTFYQFCKDTSDLPQRLPSLLSERADEVLSRRADGVMAESPSPSLSIEDVFSWCE